MKTILKNLQKGYRLKKLDDVDFKPSEAIETESLVRCHHIIGVLKIRRPRMPSTIELWADAKTNVVQRLELRWNRQENEPGPLVWSVEYQGQPSLPGNWFSIDAHISPDRQVIHVDSEADLPSPPNGTKE